MFGGKGGGEGEKPDVMGDQGGGKQGRQAGGEKTQRLAKGEIVKLTFRKRKKGGEKSIRRERRGMQFYDTGAKGRDETSTKEKRRRKKDTATIPSILRMFPQSLPRGVTSNERKEYVPPTGKLVACEESFWVIDILKKKLLAPGGRWGGGAKKRAGRIPGKKKVKQMNSQGGTAKTYLVEGKK